MPRHDIERSEIVISLSRCACRLSFLQVIKGESTEILMEMTFGAFVELLAFQD